MPVREKKKKKGKRDMEPDPQDPVAALVKILEGWAAGQERQAAEHAEQLELLRGAGRSPDAGVAAAGREWGETQKKNPPKLVSLKCQRTTTPRHF